MVSERISNLVTIDVCAPRQAWHYLQGESPCLERE